jgi:hypothetical protein
MAGLPRQIRKNLRFAGNPAVMALRFRPVALRPRLSTGLPLSSNQNMPNKSRPDKHGVRKLTVRPPRTRSHSASRPGHSGPQPQRAHSVKDLLARAVPVLSKAAGQSARQAFWRNWLQARLPTDLPPRITGITERDGNLIVFGESPAWSARLRYALQELGVEIREAQPDIREVTVRVLPGSKK